MRTSNTKTVLVFGAFDNLHDGHRFFLREARKFGDKLIVSVAADSVVMSIKKRPPVFALAERLKALRESKLVDEAVAGDTELGNWSAVKNWKPDIVALGYDQTRLEKELREYIKKEKLPIKVVRIAPLDPDHLHSRFLRN